MFALYYVGLIGGESLANRALIAVLGDVGRERDPHGRRPRADAAHGPRGETRTAAATGRPVDRCAPGDPRRRPTPAKEAAWRSCAAGPVRLHRVAEDLRATAVGLPRAARHHRPDRSPADSISSASCRAPNRAELRLLDAGVDVHGDAGRGAVRDRLLDRDVHAPLGDHGREGVGDQLLPLHAPITIGALFAAALDLVSAEVVPITNARRSDLLQERGSARAPALQLRVCRRARSHGQGDHARPHTRQARRPPDRTKGNGHGLPDTCSWAHQGGSTPRGPGVDDCKGEIHVIPAETAQPDRRVRFADRTGA